MALNKQRYEWDIYQVKQGKMDIKTVVERHGFFGVKNDITNHLVTLKLGIIEYDTPENNSQFRMREEYLKLYNGLELLYPSKENPDKWI